MSFITYLDQTSQDTNALVNAKIVKLSELLYERGCSREKRPYGYFAILSSESNRKVRFMVNTTKTNFCYEVANRSDESAIIMRENLLTVGNDEIINEIMGYIL